VALGDSLTDGFYSSGDANLRYPDVLARRFLANPSTKHLSLIAEAISGGRVLNEGIGPSTLDRLQRDVMDHPNLGAVIFLHGNNDIGQPLALPPSVSAQDIIDSYQEIAIQLHARGVKVFIGTLPPTGDLLKPAPYGPGYSTPEGNAKRAEVNHWIRTQQIFDGVIDFDAALRSALMPEHFKLRYDSGDSFHPNDAGYAAMANAVPLSMFSSILPCY
jgi:lysophospholipase L1-like esterase